MVKKSKLSKTTSLEKARKVTLRSYENVGLAPSLQESDSQEKLKESYIRKVAEDQAERARVNGFIQVGYLPHIFAYEEGYAAILPRLWHFFECDRRGRLGNLEQIASRYEAWFYIFQRWAGISQQFWKYCKPIDHLPLYDSSTRELKKEIRWGRSDTDIVMLEDLKKRMENISKNLNIDFRLSDHLFSVTSTSFKPSEDFRSVSYFGKKYILTSVQADVIKILYEAWKTGNPDVGLHYIEESLKRPSFRLRDIFKSSPSVRKDLLRSIRKGTVRLNIS